MLATMFSSIPQGAGELFHSDEELVEFCVGTLTKGERKVALEEMEVLLSLPKNEQFDFWKSIEADVFMRSPQYAEKFTGLLANRLRS